ncbi:MAG: hypothetical protein HY000_26980 [Planctomycetes bacterium]|nr:hypothetical protein [Planctomycetota bacterium]
MAIWLGLMVCGRSQLFRDPGTLWHIVVGDRILSSGRLIHSDPFSFTFGDRHWIAQWWLAECVLALLHRIGGLDTVLLSTVTVLAGLYTWVAHRLITAGIHWLVSVLITVLAIAASAYHFHPRPHLSTIVFLGWTFACLSDFETGRLSLNKLFWLVPLYVVWTNMHGGMVGGVGTIAATVAGWTIMQMIGQESPRVAYWRLIPLSILIVVCGLAALVNPYAAELPRAWFALMRSHVLPQVIVEHAPLQLSDPSAWIVLAFGAIYVGAFVGVLPKWPRVTWMIPLIWLCLAGTRVRHGPLFAITAAIALGDMFPHIRWVTWLTRHGSELLRVERPDASLGAKPSKAFGFRPAIIPACLILAAVVFQAGGVAVPVLGRGWARLDNTYWPVELVPKLRGYERTSSQGTPIFNDMLFGGFIIYFAPGLRVFIDDRCELYGDEQLLAYVRALRAEPAMVDQWAEAHRFGIALTRAGSSFDQYLRTASGWEIVQEAPAATLFERRSRGDDRAHQ